MRHDEERRRRLIALLRPYRGPSIVYVPTRAASERWTRALWQAGVAAAPYHAGLEHTVRRAVQHEFLTERIRCVVATSAFGMGIDKANVRTVIHLGVSTSLEAYYQEAGRAGRDGRKSDCVMLWTGDDLRVTRAIVNDASKLDPLLRYARSVACRRELLLAHFGERLRRCAGCDRCVRWRALRRKWLRAA
jgi:superfamily II DNA helicase RecQ